MERLLKEKDIRPNELSPLTLAFIGDTVFDLLVREKLICEANRPANDLHNLAVQKVKASAQAGFVEKILPHLNENEVAVYKRGRNAKSVSPAKNQSVTYYRRATGFEALMGYLYLKKEYKRMLELVKIGLDSLNEEE